MVFIKEAIFRPVKLPFTLSKFRFKDIKFIFMYVMYYISIKYIYFLDHNSASIKGK